MACKAGTWQVHIPVPKQYIHRAHFTVQIPNQQHQFDVAYMPQHLPREYLQVHLNCVDVASRYKVAKPLRTKKASDVAFLLKNMYESES